MSTTFKTNAPGFVKDSKGLVTNTNTAEYEMVKRQRQARRQEVDLRRQVQVLEERMARLESLLGDVQ